MITGRERNVGFGFAGFFIIFLLSACSSEESQQVTVLPSDKFPESVVTSQESVESSSPLWEGQAAGYVVQSATPNDDVDFLIHLGRVLAAIERANHYDKEQGMSNPFTEKVLAGYAAIDPFVTGKSNTSLSLQPLLSEVAAPNTFAIVTDKSRAKRNE